MKALLFFLLACSSVTAAQEATALLTLDQIEAVAAQSNPELKAMARQIAIAEARVRPASALDDASFMYRGWGVPFSQPVNFNQAQNMFMLTQALPGWGKRGLRRDIARQDLETSKAMFEAKRREISTRVRKAYFDLLRTRDELRLHHEQLALAQQALESARVKYTVGRVPQQDVLKAQVALTALVQHRLEFEVQRDLARATLNTLMARNPDTPLNVTGEYVPVRDLPNADELRKRAMESRPELRAGRSEIQRAEAQVRLARKAYTPDVTVGAGYMLMPAGSAFRNNYMAEVSINLPWLNRGRHDAEIGVAQAGIASEQSEFEATKAQVFLEIEEALIRARAAQTLTQLYAATLRPQAQSTFKAATAAYQTDQTDFLNLLDAQKTMLDVEYAYYRALADFDVRVAELELAIGAPLAERTAEVTR
ncbi:MAG: TolC family protein [Acidobacteriales bacterium]|nr:TolC family protein [Terriglobales bacterium]